MAHDPKELRESARWMMQNESRINCGNPAVLISYADLIERHAKLEWLAAAVEGPEEATPWADSIISCIGETDSETCDEIRQLERQRNAALRALKAERERANKLADLLRVHDRLDALAAQEGK